MNLIAHRGFAAVNPENTLAAFRDAGRRADGVELDVRRCGSGDLVTVHDATLDRVTDVSGPVAAVDRETLRSLSVLGSGEGVPTLAEAFDAIPESVVVHVELKEAGTAADAAAVAVERPHDVVVSSFLPDALAAVREVADLPTALLFADDADRHLDRAADLGCEFVHPPVSACLTGDLVERAHDRGFAVDAWTVETAAEATRLRRAGVDGVIADDPDVA